MLQQADAENEQRRRLEAAAAQHELIDNNKAKLAQKKQQVYTHTCIYTRQRTSSVPTHNSQTVWALFSNKVQP